MFLALEIIDFSEDDEEDDSGIFSSTGAQRVIEALHTTPWPNMERRKSQNTKPGAAQTKAATKTDSAQGEEQRREEKNNKQNGNELDAALLPDVAEVFKAVGDFGDGSAGNKERGEEDDDDFEELFSKFASIKDRASGMSDNERKAYAEKVATSFWMALGGEDDEVGGLDSDTE